MENPGAETRFWREFADFDGLGCANPKARTIGEAFAEHSGVRKGTRRAKVMAEGAKRDGK